MLQTWDDHFQFAHARRKRNSVKIRRNAPKLQRINPGEFVMSPASGAAVRRDAHLGGADIRKDLGWRQALLGWRQAVLRDGHPGCADNRRDLGWR